MQPRLLNDEIRIQISSLFRTELSDPVELVYFVKKDTCETCRDTRQLLEEVVSLSDLLCLQVYDIDDQSLLADKYHVSLTPGLVIIGKDQENVQDYGIRFLGIPSGYEFSSLIHAIALVSRRDSGLKSEVRDELKKINTPINLKVFVTPT